MFQVMRTSQPHPTVQADAQRARFRSPEELADLPLAPLIDHTLLALDATADAHARHCDEALHYHFASVCVRPNWVTTCATRLHGSPVKTITVISFHQGRAHADVRINEAKAALDAGAHELDTVITLDALRAGDYNRVLDDIAAVVTVAAPKPVKVIIESGVLNHAQKLIACALTKASGAAYIKTSTGFAGDQGATADDVHLMRNTVGPQLGIKASGGIRTAAAARTMIAAGATRLGTSASVAIVTATPDASGTAHGY